MERGTLRNQEPHNYLVSYHRLLSSGGGRNFYCSLCMTLLFSVMSIELESGVWIRMTGEVLHLFNSESVFYPFGYSVQLDGTADMHSAVPYYVAAQLVMYDDAFRYQALRNEYETKITLLHDPVFVEETPVNNVYDFFGGM